MTVPTTPRDNPSIPAPRKNGLPGWLSTLGERLGRMRRERPRRFWGGTAILVTLLASVLAASMTRSSGGVPLTIPYTELAGALGRGEVSRLVVEGSGSRLIAELRTPHAHGGESHHLVTASVPLRAVSLADLERWGALGATVQVAAEPGRGATLLPQLLIVVLALGALGFVLTWQRRGGRISEMRFSTTPPSRQLTLADVGGAREARADLRDIIQYLREPARFEAMGARCPKGVLLVGPPGTGKTLLARAVAGEAGCPVITAAGSDFNEMFIGVGSQRIRTLAKQARAQAPCIVFIDEFDSLGGRRGRPNRSGEEEVTLNQLLAEMDGMAGSEGVVWMGATNREDMLDPAVRRPGRFDRVVEVGLPTAADRAEILRIHAARSPLAPDVDLDRLAALTVGHSGAELANLLNEAAIIAVHEESSHITRAHIEQARDRILLGRVRTGVVIGQDERRMVALHEAGHAVVGLVACPEDTLHKVTIEPRGRSLGAAHFAPDTDRHLHSRRYLEGVIAKAMGGRAAETVFLGHDAVTSGAGGDLVQATGIARRMVAEFGMSSDVGLISADALMQGGGASAELQSRIDAAVRALIQSQAERAEKIVRQYQTAVDAIADALLERDVLMAEEVITIAARHGVPLASTIERIVPLAPPNAGAAA